MSELDVPVFLQRNPTALVAVNAPTRDECCQQILAALNRTVEGFIDVGRALIEAKAALPHGDFEAMVREDLPFGERTAQMLVAISRDIRLSNTKHVSLLPPNWGTLYAITQLSDAEFEAAVAQKVIHGEAKRSDIVQFRQQARRALPAPVEQETCTVSDLSVLIERGFRAGCIYADPPWRYGNQATRAATGKHYVDSDGDSHPGMTLEEIAALPIGELAAETSHLHLWTTNGFLFEAKDIIDAWGFTYKSCFVWVKPQMGIGNYWRVSHEFLLLATRGSATFADKNHMSWLQAPRGKHSAKPEKIRHVIEKVSPGPRLELFGRARAEGWIVWGNEIERNLFNQSVDEAAA